MASKLLTDDSYPPGSKEGRWPAGATGFERFEMNLNWHPKDPKQQMHYERLMRRAFQKRNVTILDHELINTTFWVPGEIDPETNRRTKEPRTTKRHFVRLEMDAWVKKDDPTLSRWEKFKHWLLRTPLPVAETPNRVTLCYSLSMMQFKVFAEAYDRGFQ